MHSRAALRHILGAYSDRRPGALTFITDANGKPRLESGPHFNLSHSGEVMLLAVSAAGEVGVDIERCGRLDHDWQAVTLRTFSDGERSQLDQMREEDKARAALRGWVRKEAYTKARGAGFAYGFSSFTVNLDTIGVGPMLVEDAKDPGATMVWRLQDLASPPGFAASLAHAGCRSIVSYIDYVELTS